MAAHSMISSDATTTQGHILSRGSLLFHLKTGNAVTSHPGGGWRGDTHEASGPGSMWPWAAETHSGPHLSQGYSCQVGSVCPIHLISENYDTALSGVRGLVVMCGDKGEVSQGFTSFCPSFRKGTKRGKWVITTWLVKFSFAFVCCSYVKRVVGFPV